MDSQTPVQIDIKLDIQTCLCIHVTRYIEVHNCSETRIFKFKSVSFG